MALSSEQPNSGYQVTDWSDFDALTFDCYGTLIDWESGILSALGTLLGSAAPDDPDRLLEEFGRFEPEAEAGVFRTYRAVLEDVARAFGREHGVAVNDEQAARFAASVADWPPFDDTVDALRRLATRYRLAIVSNVDDDLFAGSAAKLGVSFDEVVTAQQVKSYKPAHGHFHEIVSRLDLPRERILHVAQSLYHDVAPASELGFTCVWVNRRAGRAGGGATPASEAAPDLEVPDLATLARTIEGTSTSVD
jgi:2-haloacid dehalogenase